MENQVNHARAALDVLSALQGGPVAEPEARREVAPAEQAAAPVPGTDRVTRAADRAARRAAARTTAHTVARSSSRPVDRAHDRIPEAVTGRESGLDRIETGPGALARRITGLLLLASLGATGLAGWAAWTTRDTTLAGAALILGALTAGLWFLRVISVPTTVSLLGPRLEVTQAGRHHVWDLASPYSPVDPVRGRPGWPGWQVVLRNADGTTFTIDASMVPAKRFTEILSRYRPEL